MCGDTYRQWLEGTIEYQVTPDNVVNRMLTSYGNWNAVCVFARKVLMQFRLAERARSAELEGSTHLICTPPKQDLIVVPVTGWKRDEQDWV